ncbi:3' exoribonuclease [Caudoviricetes sp.]|nr:3' exoribonuclease [Caudoviricetes sp.]
MTDISIDLETLSLSNTARILSIGACEFNRYTGEIGKTFYCSLREPPEEIMKDLHVSKSTTDWWAKQSDQVKGALKLCVEDYYKGLSLFCLFMRSYTPSQTCIWANDPQFDCAILKHSLSLYHIMEPWKFYNERSYRTIKEVGYTLFGIDYASIEEAKVKHHALEDAVYQAKVISKTLKTLKEKAQ